MSAIGEEDPPSRLNGLRSVWASASASASVSLSVCGFCAPPPVPLIPLIRLDAKASTQSNDEHEQRKHSDEPGNAAVVSNLLASLRVITISIRASPFLFRIVIIPKVMRRRSKIRWRRAGPPGTRGVVVFRMRSLLSASRSVWRPASPCAMRTGGGIASQVRRPSRVTCARTTATWTSRAIRGKCRRVVLTPGK